MLVARDGSNPRPRCRRRPAERFEGAVGGESARARQQGLRALERLQDADEVLNVALKAEHTDTAVAALERLTDVSALTESLPAGPQQGCRASRQGKAAPDGRSVAPLGRR